MWLKWRRISGSAFIVSSTPIRLPSWFCDWFRSWLYSHGFLLIWRCLQHCEALKPNWGEPSIIQVQGHLTLEFRGVWGDDALCGSKDRQRVKRPLQRFVSFHWLNLYFWMLKPQRDSVPTSEIFLPRLSVRQLSVWIPQIFLTCTNVWPSIFTPVVHKREFVVRNTVSYLVAATFETECCK